MNIHGSTNADTGGRHSPGTPTPASRRKGTVENGAKGAANGNANGNANGSANGSANGNAKGPIADNKRPDAKGYTGQPTSDEHIQVLHNGSMKASDRPDFGAVLHPSQTWDEPATPARLAANNDETVARLSEIERIVSDEELDISFTDLKRNVDAVDAAQVSVAIPGTGLKRNLPEDHGEHPEGHSHSHGHSHEHGAERADRAQHHSRETTPTDNTYNAHREHMLPPDARGRDSPSARETPEQQEGPTGSGYGQHERHLDSNLVPGQRAHAEPGAEYFHRLQQHQFDSDNSTPRELQDISEHEQFKDELGRVPGTLPPLKAEAKPPGSQHEIVLEPRLIQTRLIPPPNPAGDIIIAPSVTVTPTITQRDENQHHHRRDDDPAPNMPRRVGHSAHPPRVSHDIKRKDKARRQSLTRTSSRGSRAESLRSQGLGTLPPGEKDKDWEDDDTDAGSTFRSALQSGANTPLSHPADPKGEHGYWSTLRTPDIAPLGESSRHHIHSGHGSGHGSSRPSATPSLANANLATPVRTYTGLAHMNTVEDMGQGSSSKTGGMRNAAARFTSKIRHRGPGGVQSRDDAVSAPMPSMTNEMLAGTLPVMILKTWLDRDEDGHRAVPVLLGNLRFRIGDSVGIKAGGRHTGREMFKIECEYGDGAIKWVVYRELRDFLMLHAHYKAANIGTSLTGLRSSRRVEMPEFPKNSLPYWAREKADKSEMLGDAKDKVKDKVKDKLGASTALERNERQQDGFGPTSRTALQQYLIDLIRAVLFRPESNRLCIFFELSALTVALAPRGGFQGKAGFIKILNSKAGRKNNQPGLLPSTWRQHRSPKWFIVRESYLVATDGPQETDIYDVFILDGDFSIERPKRAYRKGLHLLSGHHHKGHKSGDESHELDLADDDSNKDTSQHTFYVSNSQRRIKLVAKNARQMHQFIVSMERVAFQCLWTGGNRFDSFAPVRMNVAAQWLVDGRDYFWNLSRAINMARSRIYIHDWWISPEIYLRRPGDERYRLDNLLKRKAEEGVRIFIVIYNEVSAKTTPVESLYAKRSLMGLHPNIMVQRSPSHLPSGALYWSHHEKMCVIDEAIGFMGGLDLCFGRWDTSQHILTDEDHTAPDGPDGPVWRGKDYWNERVAEFHDLDKPFEDAFDRDKTPRMPWHDVGLQIVGQPARDLCRHFCQRWNYLLRIKNHTRKMPFLLPPADFTERELIDLKLQGTCEVQICRSVGPWSMGTLTKIEHSIHNAYVKSIQLSEHFVYIENQFFITSTVVDTTTIENRIGDALVQRIIRAHKEGTKWMACVVIPLLPGYTYPIDTAEASSVRLILECQNRTICRGAHSIYTRLRKEGINPDDYITFFSLRGWAKFKSGALTTEQVYIHGKTMIVDDRLVLCGSANINERSQRGDRDSELLAVVRDTDMIDGTMAGKPFKVGRYAHTLRMRLMREHVGVDVDAIEEDELMLRKPLAEASEVALWDPDNEQSESHSRGITRVKKVGAPGRLNHTVASALESVVRGVGENMKREAGTVIDKVAHPIDAFEGKVSTTAPTGAERQDIGPDGKLTTGFASSVVPTLEEVMLREHPQEAANNVRYDDDDTPPEATVTVKRDATEAKPGVEAGQPHDHVQEKFGVPASAPDGDGAPQRPSHELLPNEEGTEGRDARKVLRRNLAAKPGHGTWTMPTPTPKIDPNRFHDPLDEHFWKEIWVASAVHNTQIYRKVFRCVPDDLVTTWDQYKAFANHHDKFGRTEESQHDVKATHDQAGSGGGVAGPAGADSKQPQTAAGGVQNDMSGSRGAGAATSRPVLTTSASTDDRKPSGDGDAWAQWELDEMEDLLGDVRGHLVLYSTRFLEAEDLANNFLFNQERILPLVIYD